MVEPVSPEAPRLTGARILHQNWVDLTFLHWPVAPRHIAHLYPAGTEPDSFDGISYVGLVAFRMTGTGFGHGPGVLGSFLETNVRLYSVDRTGRRGVVFLSLDTPRLDVALAARAALGVRYRWARMSYRRDGNRHAYTTVVRWPRTRASSRIEVEAGDVLVPGRLEHFLTARWGLHVAHGGRTWFVPNEHPAWSLRSAELIDFDESGLFDSVGLGGLCDGPPVHVAFSDGLPARFGLPVRAGTPRR
ncbi:YqjF family protein [Mycolicibacterium septicum]|uniref:YqjF family protein n=1 Tax=Mycolicibacterium septicum TaxID=98668 RepID=A0ABW9LYD6_9MYCO